VAVKTLTIKKSVYEKLSSIKKKDESFSDLFERLSESENPDLMRFAGILKDIPESDFKEIKKRMADFRKDFNESFNLRQRKIQKELK